jgi:hypothetical protein
MAISLLDAMKDAMTPPVRMKMHAVLGEPGAAVDKALELAMPMLLYNLASSRTPVIARAGNLALELATHAPSPPQSTDLVDLALRAPASDVVERFLLLVTGGDTHPATQALAAHGRISGRSAARLMNIAAAGLLMHLARLIDVGLTARGVATVLTAQKSSFKAALVKPAWA